MVLTATLITDGTSDRVLLPFINFVLDEHSPIPHQVQFAEGMHQGPLLPRMQAVLDLFPCDVLFVHRDAERAAVTDRATEIEQAFTALSDKTRPHLICIIPVRMTEAWLLVDALAIRRAAGNPSGTQDLDIPPIGRLESLPDPKDVLFRALIAAKNVGTRRVRKLRPEALRHRVSELMNDLDLVRALPSFRHFEAQVEGYFAAR